MSKPVRTPAVDDLCDAILTLKTREETYKFLEDVCTVNELQALSQRFEVAKMLTEDKTYAEIADETGASTATVSRVNRSLVYGADGYEVVLSRMGITGKKEQEKKESGRKTEGR
ncbi:MULTISPECIES: YerC/YecD family TrpR-related protein [Porcincola]|jgi:TrpR-related protein YerC/YecD|uniref:TrpR YerC/YecD n=1 Tax=Porcincola intestinalis TaxID=2606632 RepID=A0A6L5XBD3_9FIRM|nr:YerC/YecD family TrpR-related protein [Porcincola intestinalis]MCI6238452.1 YerC/YecD family TrpR-related protein [Lachnospiraceae bacterium]MCI6698561.1 YerC/YecD family TrpR-related protein [Lachnospiraceae bacterium]MCI6766266.1 YerC/YecD family TrpR-related protein [Lachnospiraceae bacterium]MCI7092294.1 YerC/YecD family TrpR-related protein [Lachnospiraceae bacterium]MDD7060994.1 YerC/YecD family TrpR-related protein [Porcincola intestinalis]